MKYNLYSYQIEAYKRFYENKCRYYFAFDTGMGKTLTALNIAKDFKNVLIISPASVKIVWEKEMEKFNLYPKNSYTIVSYDYFRENHKAILDKVYYDLIIFDEAHKLKNPSAKITRLCMNIFPKSNKIMLSATPFEKLLDFYSQLKILTHEHPLWNYNLRLYKEIFFTLDFWKNIKDFRSEGMKETFYTKFVYPYVWFLKREDVLDLPELIENEVELNGKREYYKQLATETTHHTNAVAYFNYLYHQESLLKSRIDFVREFIEDNPKTIVFSYYKAPLEVLRSQIKDCYFITGDNKKDLEKALLEGGKPILATYCINEGVDLSHYKNVVFLCLPLAYRDYYQAYSRVYRAGQKSKVYVMKPIASRIDKYVLRILSQKKNVLEELANKDINQLQEELSHV